MDTVKVKRCISNSDKNYLGPSNYVTTYVNTINMQNHNHELSKNLRNLIAAILINISIVVFEIIFGILSGSLSLISDAIHNLSDVLSMILGYSSEKISSRANNDKKTYGYKKIEFLAAFANAIVISIAIIYIIYEAIIRLMNPLEVLSKEMIIVGVIAAIGNGLATWVLTKKSKDNLNMKAVWLHSLQDTLISLGVIAGAIIIHFTGWNIIDPLLSILVALLLIKSTYSLMKQSINSLLDAVPTNISFNELKNDLLGLSDVKEINDLHIWENSSRNIILTVHIQVEKKEAIKDVFVQAKKLIHDKYNIEHTTLQIISRDTDLPNLCCKQHCN